MKVLIAGARGQLGQAAQQVFRANQDDVLVWNRPQHDVTNPSITHEVVGANPDLLINAAAWTNVDGAESDPDGAYAANMLGPLYLAEGCRRCGARMIHVSTNEVFAGDSGRFYREYDQPNPGSVYARSKFAGEEAVRSTLTESYIVRVAWQFGVGENNFPSKMLAAGAKHKVLRVVNDEFGNPTYAKDVAHAMTKLIQHEHYGIYHLINEGRASRFELAQAALLQWGLGEVSLTPIAGSQWPRPTTPPGHAVLVNQAAATLGIQLRPWQEALAEYLIEKREQKA
ncbi:MAG: dTDP-4-dehydrorhamnose reductase [Chloroflexota bacterium]